MSRAPDANRISYLHSLYRGGHRPAPLPPHLLSYEELVALSADPELDPALSEKLLSVTAEPFISNEALYGGVQPGHRVRSRDRRSAASTAQRAVSKRGVSATASMRRTGHLPAEVSEYRAVLGLGPDKSG